MYVHVHVCTRMSDWDTLYMYVNFIDNYFEICHNYYNNDYNIIMALWLQYYSSSLISVTS